MPHNEAERVVDGAPSDQKMAVRDGPPFLDETLRLIVAMQKGRGGTTESSSRRRSPMEVPAPPSLRSDCFSLDPKGAAPYRELAKCGSTEPTDLPLAADEGAESIPITIAKIGGGLRKSQLGYMRSILVAHTMISSCPKRLASSAQ
jgi:hypothetical protein